MNQNAVRVIDTLNEKEKELLEDYKLGIEVARTPIGIRFNKHRANKLMAKAKARYIASRRTLTL